MGRKYMRASTHDARWCSIVSERKKTARLTGNKLGRVPVPELRWLAVVAQKSIELVVVENRGAVVDIRLVHSRQAEFGLRWIACVGSQLKLNRTRT